MAISEAAGPLQGRCWVPPRTEASLLRQRRGRPSAAAAAIYSFYAIVLHFSLLNRRSAFDSFGGTLLGTRSPVGGAPGAAAAKKSWSGVSVGFLSLRRVPIRGGAHRHGTAQNGRRPEWRPSLLPPSLVVSSPTSAKIILDNQSPAPPLTNWPAAECWSSDHQLPSARGRRDIFVSRWGQGFSNDASHSLRVGSNRRTKNKPPSPRPPFYD
jgi:hypothetical protein